MPRFVALLRGINVGGNKKVPMADLKKLLEKNGYKNVKTLLASGNVVFDASSNDAAKLRKEVETIIEKKFGFPVPVLIRTLEELQKLHTSAPFKGIPVTKETRLYITFLSDKPTSKLKIPFASEKGNFRILRVSNSEVISVLVIDPTTDTLKLMAILEKEYGKNVTTRNWNTVEKLLK